MRDTRLPLRDDWTAADGVSNCSALFEDLSYEVAELIRSSAHSLLAGNVNQVGRLIMAQLAHKHGLAPAREALGA